MLRVKIDLIPHGDEAKARTLQTLTIANTGGTARSGDYVALLSDDSGLLIERTTITHWPRLERDAAALVHEALRQMGYGGQA